MGMCGSLAKKKKITVIQGNSKSIQTNESNIIEQSKPNYLYLTAESNWTLVIDFMKYKELKELSKVNRQFNRISRSVYVLSKFYQNKQQGSINVSYSEIKLPITATNSISQKSIGNLGTKITLSNNLTYFHRIEREDSVKSFSDIQDKTHSHRSCSEISVNKSPAISKELLHVESLVSDNKTPSFRIHTDENMSSFREKENFKLSKVNTKHKDGIMLYEFGGDKSFRYRIESYDNEESYELKRELKS